MGIQHLARVNGVIGGSSKKFYYHNDHLGSALAVTDENGNKVVERDFTPFGERINTDVYDDEPRDLDEDESGFTGKDWDEDVGLYYYNARWYDPAVGRFISEDSVADDPNLYGYCHGNPVNFIDPTGHAGVASAGAAASPAKFGVKLNVAGGLLGVAAMQSPELGAIIQGVSAFGLLLEKIKAIPLVLVYGWGGNWTTWTDMLTEATGDEKFNQLAEEFKSSKLSKKEKVQVAKKAVELAKSYNIYIYDYSNKFATASDKKEYPLSLFKPDVIAPDLKQFLIDNELFEKDFNVVTHSMGGLVVRETVQNFDVKIKKLAMIAPPNMGTEVADKYSWLFSMESAVHYMRTDSQEIANINSTQGLMNLTRNIGEIKIYGATHDEAVKPYTNVNIPGSNIKPNYYEMFYGHGTLTSDSTVISDIFEFLYGVKIQKERVK